MCQNNSNAINETVQIEGTEVALKECHINKDFLLAGFAVVTVANGLGAWETFLVKKVEGEGDYAGRVTFFVRIFKGGDNTDEKCYRYVGILRADTGYISFTKASPVNFLQSDAGHAWRFLADCLWGRQNLADNAPATIHHMGFCGACGRPLTSLESLEAGMGPICRGKANKAKKAWEAQTVTA